MEKRIQLFVVFLTIVEISTVCSQPTESEFNSTTNALSVISNLEYQLAQCRGENKTQTISTILRGIQKLQTHSENNNNIEIKLKQKDEIIACQEAQLADKSNLLDIQVYKTSKAKQDIFDYKEKIKSLQSTIISQNTIINKTKVEIIEWKSKNKNKNRDIQNEKKETELTQGELSNCEKRCINRSNQLNKSLQKWKHCINLEDTFKKDLQTKELDLKECQKQTISLPTSCLNITRQGTYEIELN
ncbi:uncharacterized protein LOC117564922 [Drosophila albomicans]|uniref:Uncharacterized protein LOC117564922 n=1 Tax=Drosophila albomicans TaxID=7291 RepID=A0A6P8XMU1_DROAB|nr:uncharacterized protein LOC117564922 [Drosophila albomicans]